MHVNTHFTIVCFGIFAFDAVNRLIKTLEEKDSYGPVYTMLLVAMGLTLFVCMNSILKLWEKAKCDVNYKYRNTYSCIDQRKNQNGND